MLKKILVTAAVFIVVGLGAFGVCTMMAAGTPAPTPSVAPVPLAIQDDSPCPVTGCASGSCHGFDDVPEPDGQSEMVCPEVGCASVECHAWDALTGRYHQASDASLNVWILMPVVLVVVLVLIIRKTR